MGSFSGVCLTPRGDKAAQQDTPIRKRLSTLIQSRAREKKNEVVSAGYRRAVGRGVSIG